MKEACRKMHDMTPDLALALTIIERDSDNRKNVLARHQVKHIKAGESATASEVMARADAEYDKEFRGYSDTYEMAIKRKLEYENEKTSWETCRSILARQREMIKTLPGTED